MCRPDSSGSRGFSSKKSHTSRFLAGPHYYWKCFKTAAPDPGQRLRSIRGLTKRLLLGAVLQNLLGVVVMDFGLVIEHFGVGILQQLSVIVAQKLANALLHARVVHLQLARRTFLDQLIDDIAHGLVPRSFTAADGENVGDLPGFELADRRKHVR